MLTGVATNQAGVAVAEADARILVGVRGATAP